MESSAPQRRPSVISHRLPPQPNPAHRHLVVFVHGFISSKECWNELIALLERDPQMNTVFDFACFEYESPKINPLFWRRIPRLLEIAKSLGAFLNRAELREYREVALVGHSQGGLVILTYLADQLQRGAAQDLERLRQVILIATPNLGSSLLSGVRRFLSLFSFNPQERALRVLDPQISDVRAVISERIVGTQDATNVAWPIPVQCFWGKQDGVVVEASARGPFDSDVANPLEGDHSGVIRPRNLGDPRYLAIADALLVPFGHRSVYEIDHLALHVGVRPLAGPTTFTFPHKKQAVVTDNIAQVNRTVTFSRKNRCQELFPLDYLTSPEGYVDIVDKTVENAAPSQHTLSWEMGGTNLMYSLHPRQGETYKLFLDVYKGFDAGNRNVHFHLVPPERRCHYNRVTLELDLRAYIAAGWTLTQAPVMSFFPRDTGHDSMCGKRRTTEPMLPVESSPDGRWRWEVEHVREGILDLIWDVAPADALRSGGA